MGKVSGRTPNFLYAYALSPSDPKGACTSCHASNGCQGVNLDTVAARAIASDTASALPRLPPALQIGCMGMPERRIYRKRRHTSQAACAVPGSSSSAHQRNAHCTMSLHDSAVWDSMRIALCRCTAVQCGTETPREVCGLPAGVRRSQCSR